MALWLFSMIQTVHLLMLEYPEKEICVAAQRNRLQKITDNEGVYLYRYGIEVYG